jgi:hypothetical protein
VSVCIYRHRTVLMERHVDLSWENLEALDDEVRKSCQQVQSICCIVIHHWTHCISCHVIISFTISFYLCTMLFTICLVSEEHSNKYYGLEWSVLISFYWTVFRLAELSICSVVTSATQKLQYYNPGTFPFYQCREIPVSLKGFLS